jgi:putative SOS response-associated peptidase YedK
MCNNYTLRIPPNALFDAFSQLRAPVRWLGGAAPNVPELPDIRIRDSAPIVRWADGVAEFSMTPWAWAAPGGKPVFNFRSDGRDFSRSDRCLIPADGFFEFTARSDGRKSPKHKHRFTLAGADWFWIAGIVKESAFTMLTTEPGPDIAPYHDRQVVVLPPDQGLDWLSLTRPQADLLRPLLGGSLRHEQLS